MGLLEVLLYFPNKLIKVFLSVGFSFSLSSLISALGIALLFLALGRLAKRRRVRLGTILRGLFPRRLLSASSGADAGYFLFSVFLYGVLFGWAALSFRTVSNAVIDTLVAAFGARPATSLPDIASRSIMTVVVFLAYEFGYWVDHYLKHRVPALWELHKVHHTATVLTPLTVFRLHPLDTVIFYNILALAIGSANGIANYLFGATVYEFSIADSNLILVLFLHLVVHLQHTHVWIPFRGALGHLLMSPAHHQIHHSDNPAHFNKNLGSCLAVWDWLFGTLYVPDRKPEALRFGVASEHGDPHTITEAFVAPFGRAAVKLAAGVSGGPQPARDLRAERAELDAYSATNSSRR